MLTKNSFLEEISKQFVLTARSKGFGRAPRALRPRVPQRDAHRGRRLSGGADRRPLHRGAPDRSDLLAGRPRASRLRSRPGPRFPGDVSARSTCSRWSACCCISSATSPTPWSIRASTSRPAEPDGAESHDPPQLGELPGPPARLPVAQAVHGAARAFAARRVRLQRQAPPDALRRRLLRAGTRRVSGDGLPRCTGLGGRLSRPGGASADPRGATAWMLWPPIPYSYDTIDWQVGRPVPGAAVGSPLARHGRCVPRRPRPAHLRLPPLGPVRHRIDGDQHRDWRFWSVARAGLLRRLDRPSSASVWSRSGPALPVLFLLIILSSLVRPSVFALVGAAGALQLDGRWSPSSGRSSCARATSTTCAASRALGASNLAIMRKDVLPNAMVATLTFIPVPAHGIDHAPDFPRLPRLRSAGGFALPRRTARPRQGQPTGAVARTRRLLSHCSSC